MNARPLVQNCPQCGRRRHVSYCRTVDAWMCVDCLADSYDHFHDSIKQGIREMSNNITKADQAQALREQVAKKRAAV